MFISAADAAHCIHVNKNNDKRKTTDKNVNKWFNKKCANMRKKYNRAKVRYKKNPSNNNLVDLNCCGKKYKKMVKKAKHDYNKKFITNLRNMKNTSSREYWKLINEKSHNTVLADFDSLTDHFKDLNKAPTLDSQDFKSFSGHPDNELINSNFTVDEVKDGIKN